MLPSASGVIDPLLSTGFPLTLLGVSRLAQILESHWRQPTLDDALEEYARQTKEELEATALLVGALYASMNEFKLFTHLTLLYFAGASFAETARRLGRPELAGSFLLHRDPVFGPLLRECSQEALRRPRGEASLALVDKIRRGIERFDVAGLTDQTRNNWFPARAADLFESCDKLRATPQDIGEMLRRCGVVSR